MFCSYWNLAPAVSHQTCSSSCILYVRILHYYLPTSQARNLSIILDISHIWSITKFCYFISYIPNPPTSLHILATWLIQTSITSCLEYPSNVLISLRLTFHPPHCSQNKWPFQNINFICWLPIALTINAYRDPPWPGPLHLSSFVACPYAPLQFSLLSIPTLVIQATHCIQRVERAVLAPASEPLPMQLLQHKMLSLIPSPGCLYLAIRFYLRYPFLWREASVPPDQISTHIMFHIHLPTLP